jgi:hypothetical protein
MVQIKALVSILSWFGNATVSCCVLILPLDHKGVQSCGTKVVLQHGKLHVAAKVNTF